MPSIPVDDILDNLWLYKFKTHEIERTVQARILEFVPDQYKTHETRERTVKNNSWVATLSMRYSTLKDDGRCS